MGFSLRGGGRVYRIQPALQPAPFVGGIVRAPVPNLTYRTPEAPGTFGAPRPPRMPAFAARLFRGAR